MNDRVHLDRDALYKFIDLMDTVSAETGHVLDAAAPLLARSGAPQGAYRGGIKLTVGSVDFAHPGRVAGELMADRIAESLNFVISLEEGARALKELVTDVMRAMDRNDSIAADELERINKSAPVSSSPTYGLPPIINAGLTGGS
ncbi:MAG: hypothetical protein ACRD0P_23735 [Stackebrandtia sp.]